MLPAKSTSSSEETTDEKRDEERRSSSFTSFTSSSSSSKEETSDDDFEGERAQLSKDQPPKRRLLYKKGEEEEASSSSSSTVFPPDHKVFRAKKTMRVPVKERKDALRNKTSIEHWLKDPNESLGVVFDRNERLSEDTWKVFVASNKKIAFWEISPAFTLEILPNETEFGKQAFRGFDMMLCADEGAEECSWVNDVSVFANIFCQLRVDREDDAEDEDDVVDDKKQNKYVTPIVVVDVDVTIAALLPSFVNAIPGFTNIGEASIAASIDFARDGAAKRVQTAYDDWAERRRRKKSPPP